MKKAKWLSYPTPVTLVRGNPLIIADGFHRLCALYYVDKEAVVPCIVLSQADAK